MAKKNTHSPASALEAWLHSIVQRHPRVVAIGKFMLIFGIFFIFARKSFDPDFGWHLVSGNYYRRYGIPAHDLYSYTARSFPWINHEIGNDITLSYLFQIGGYTLASAFYSILWAGSLFLSNKKARMGILLLGTTALLPYAGVRALAWSIFLFAVVIRLCTATDWRAKLLLPLVILLWVNLHGGFIVGLAVIFYYALRHRKQKVWWVIGLTSALATLINPYGQRIYIEIIRTFSDPSLHNHINEWRAAYFLTAGLVYLVIWMVGFWFYQRKNLKNWFGLTPLLALASFSASRNVPFFVVNAQKDLEHYFSELQRILKESLGHASAIVVAIFVIASIAWPVYALRAWDYQQIIHTDPQARYPHEAIAYLRAHPCHGNLFNDYDYGGYLIWKLPEQPVYIDGRMPTWRDDKNKTYYDRYHDVLTKPAVQRSEFIRYNITCILIKNTSNHKDLIKNLQASGWRRVFNTGPVLLVRDTAARP